LITDKNHYGEAERLSPRLFTLLRPTAESINQTFEAQLGLERHSGRNPAGIIVRVLRRVLVLTAAIWQSDKTGQPIKRSLTAYDHRALGLLVSGESGGYGVPQDPRRVHVGVE
jgi:hypothetical protein